jgi:hypothetical protein
MTILLVVVVAWNTGRRLLNLVFIKRGFVENLSGSAVLSDDGGGCREKLV